MKTYIVEAPSNIAFLKYWGKANVDQQWPSGDSFSMTLNNAKTITRAQKSKANKDLVTIEGLTEGHRRAEKHLEKLRHLTGFKDHLVIESKNTFPAECGIASSASGMAALTIAALCAWTEAESFEDLQQHNFSREAVAHLARMGSGSAGRSLWGGFVHWQKGTEPSRQKLCQVYPPEKWQLCDLICVLSNKTKSVSSSGAHQAAWQSPLFPARLAVIPERLAMMRQAIEKKDLESLGTLLETEALEMHAVMMTGQPSVQYLSEKSIQFITWLREKRRQDGLPAWFTIDAGPNIHVICQSNQSVKIIEEIHARFNDIDIIEDYIGNGPQIKLTCD